MKAQPKLAIIGRPNVGKSTLFNRLLGRRRALVHDEPGVTRDRLEEEATWWVKGAKLDLRLIDTGGLGGERFAQEIERQVEIALSEADAAILVFDAQAGLTPQDEDLIRKFKQSGIFKKIPVLGAVNKVDAEVHETLIADFYAAGLETILTLSAEHGRGIDDLQEAVAAALGFDATTERAEAEAAAEAAETAEFLGELPEEIPDEAPLRTPRIAIVGQPNVGKSTLVNALLGQERMITSPIAGTTVDSIDSIVELNGKPYVFVDTAGIRRKNKTEQGVEVLSVVQARKALDKADLAILVLNGEEGISEQDEKIGGLIEEVGCSVILLMNKWDTQRSNPKFTKELAAERIRGKMAFLRYAPIMFVSAKERKGLQDLGEMMEDILEQRKVKVATHEFTEWVRKESTIHNPANAKFFLCHQSGRNPPTFVCHVSDPEKIHFSLRRHLVNAMRERWGFMGSPVRLLFVEGNRGKKSEQGERKAEKRRARA